MRLTIYFLSWIIPCIIAARIIFRATKKYEESNFLSLLLSRLSIAFAVYCGIVFLIIGNKSGFEAFLIFILCVMGAIPFSLAYFIGLVEDQSKRGKLPWDRIPKE